MYRVDGRMDVDDPRELVVVYPAKYDVSVVMVVVNFTLLGTCVGVSTPSFVIVVIIGAIPGGKHLGSLEEEQVIIGVFTGGLIELDGTVLGELQS
ncbi:hypothetical protein RhiirA5_354029 [Rhizophagus irregularis]|uniref:Uncharacterized protein n=1 Tax=Rhizophagus irregularis TaxID=588596 RepID=A0A2I1ED66_9GLOM|nr:hypothetical protein RhiirA5_354029 [Rhizophagus irregularis]PKC73221.1 hypothetical protein RhiirA1_410837 [Rhizophagus irregularis]PKK78903.1 hypothetical protein RhiirC2_728546 [Rhizophagus irregularis]PKY20061.1 hypothetical protein RhiirB3_407759 [Rhizophagus irregularis]